MSSRKQRYTFYREPVRAAPQRVEYSCLALVILCAALLALALVIAQHWPW